MIETDPRLPSWLNSLLNSWPFNVSRVRTVAWSWGGNVLSADRPDYSAFFSEGSVSLFYNGIVFVRLCWPVGVWVQLKWTRDKRLQFGLGWKLNGRIGLTLRYQSTESAARGTLGYNAGQADGWRWGTT